MCSEKLSDDLVAVNVCWAHTLQTVPTGAIHTPEHYKGTTVWKYMDFFL